MNSYLILFYTTKYKPAGDPAPLKTKFTLYCFRVSVSQSLHQFEGFKTGHGSGFWIATSAQKVVGLTNFWRFVWMCHANKVGQNQSSENYLWMPGQLLTSECLGMMVLTCADTMSSPCFLHNRWPKSSRHKLCQRSFLDALYGEFRKVVFFNGLSMGFAAFANIIGPNIAIWSACYKDSQQAQASANLQKLVAKPNEQIFAAQYHHKVSRNTLVAQLDETWQVTKEALTPWSYDLWFHHTTVTKHAGFVKPTVSKLKSHSRSHDGKRQ